MAKEMKGFCGSVTKDGAITSNGNFSCEFVEETKTYIVDYQDHIKDPIVVVSLTGSAQGLSYRLKDKSGRFELTVYEPYGGTTEANFNFVTVQL